ncbi:MAG TPA: ATP-binding protein [Syntrophales bacterium]|nr:ATP-binding protein [Syntrophales bacterium]
MLRNSLFIKICLSFWLTTLFMIGAVLMVDWLTETGPFRSKRALIHGNPLTVAAHMAVWVFEHEGGPSLQKYVGQLEESAGTRAWLYDKNGLELSGAPGSPEARELAALAFAPGSGDFISSPETGMAAVRERSTAGEFYVMVAEIPHPLGMEPFMILIRLLVVLTVSGLICYVLARYLTAPILGLGAAVKRFASGDLSVRVGPALGNRNDEISRLALDFDSMAERIESLLTSQRVLLRDISHELRSPLSRLHVALELCRTGCGPEVVRNLDRIEREAGRLNEMIEELLTLNRVESGISGLGQTRIDLARLIQEVSEDADFEARSLNRRVAILSREECSIDGSEDLLRRAIENVARNAVRYTAEGSVVDISLRRIQGNGNPRGLITIRDHGRGVPEESIPHLFKPFYRADHGRDRESGGAGLGLAITEAAIRLHNGTVRAKNAGDGGLIVEITLPILSLGIQTQE